VTIFILEDQVNQATYLQHLLADLINDYHYPNEKISVHYKGSDLLLAAQQSTERNLYFLDIKTWIIHFNDKMIKMTVIFNKKIL